MSRRLVQQVTGSHLQVLIRTVHSQILFTKMTSVVVCRGSLEADGKGWDWWSQGAVRELAGTSDVLFWWQRAEAQEPTPNGMSTFKASDQVLSTIVWWPKKIPRTSPANTLQSAKHSRRSECVVLSQWSGELEPIVQSTPHHLTYPEFPSPLRPYH